jgi:type II secretory pathway component PulJ
MSRTLKHRPGFSLLEVLLAASILLGSVIVLGQLAQVGSRAARAAQQLSEAQNACESVLQSIVAGALPLEPLENEPLDSHPEWVVTVEIQAPPANGVAAVQVRVDSDTRQGKSPRTFSLYRWISDPTSRQQRPTHSAGTTSPAVAPRTTDRPTSQ